MTTPTQISERHRTLLLWSPLPDTSDSETLRGVLGEQSGERPAIALSINMDELPRLVMWLYWHHLKGDVRARLVYGAIEITAISEDKARMMAAHPHIVDAKGEQ